MIKESRLVNVFLTAMLALGGCVSVRPAQTTILQKSNDPCLQAPEICADTQVNLALISAATEVAVVGIQQSSKLLVTVLTTSKDPVILARLHARILDRLDSSDPAVRKSQQDALGEAGLNEKDIRSKVIKCDEVPSKDGGMTLHCN